MDLEPVSIPTTEQILELIPVQSCKDAKRIKHSLEDALFAEFIVDAFRWFDGPHGWLRRALLPQQWRFYLDNFPNYDIELPLPEASAINAVEWRDDDGVWQVVADADYELTRDGPFGRVTRDYFATWPYALRRRRSVRITFTAGYTGAEGLNPTPRPILRGVKLLVGSLYDHREADFADSRVSEVSRKIEYGIEKLAGIYRIRPDLVDAE